MENGEREHGERRKGLRAWRTEKGIGQRAWSKEKGIGKTEKGHGAKCSERRGI